MKSRILVVDDEESIREFLEIMLRKEGYEVTVAEDDYLADLPARIEALTEGWPVEVLRIRRQRGNAAARLAAEASETLDELSPHDVFARRLQQEELADDLQQALSERFRSIVTALHEETK